MRLGRDDVWLNEQLTARGVRDEDVFLFTVTDAGSINIILKEETK